MANTTKHVSAEGDGCAFCRVIFVAAAFGIPLLLRAGAHVQRSLSYTKFNVTKLAHPMTSTWSRSAYYLTLYPHTKYKVYLVHKLQDDMMHTLVNNKEHFTSTYDNVLVVDV